MQWGEDMTTTGTTWDNLKLSFAGATEMPQNIIAHELLGNIFFAHELHELARRLCATGMATGSVALIYTNAMMGGYDDNGDNLGQLEVVSCGRNKQRMNYCPRIIGKYFFCPRIARIDTNGCNGLKWRPGRSHELSLMQ